MKVKHGDMIKLAENGKFDKLFTGATASASWAALLRIESQFSDWLVFDSSDLGCRGTVF